MDSYDLFRQLTRGAKFTKRKREAPAPIPATEVEVKKEKCSFAPEVENNGKEKILNKEEEEQAEFQYLVGGSSNEPSKKKKKLKPLTPEEREQQAKDEMIAKIRRENNIKVLGKNIPAPINTFEELRTDYNVHKQLVNNLLACKYPRPTPVQMQAIPIMLQARPLMACAPTGSGKTIAFLTPIINDLRGPQKKGFRAIVLAPTRELAQQIYRECVQLAEKTALRIHIINKFNQAKQKFGPNGNKKYDILISTPNSVRYLLQQEPPALDLKSIEWFVIDEADRLMEEGQNNFKDQLDDIMAACTNPSKKVALFSATYTVPVAKWALKSLKNLARVTVGQQNSATDSVDQELLFVGNEQGKLLAVRDMVRTGLKPPVLVFVQSKERAKQLFQELLYDGINVDVIHAERTQQQRDNCVRAFREGNIWVLICTELMGRGIDFKGVNLVINYDFPPSTIAYIHRIGRTGRAGRRGKAITFFTKDDTPQLRSIAQIIKNSGGKVPEFMLTMKKPRKSELKRLANFAPKREDISTRIEPSRRNPKYGGEKEEKGVKQLPNKLQKSNKNKKLKENSKFNENRQEKLKKVEKALKKRKVKNAEKSSKQEKTLKKIRKLKNDCD